MTTGNGMTLKQHPLTIGVLEVGGAKGCGYVIGAWWVYLQLMLGGLHLACTVEVSSLIPVEPV